MSASYVRPVSASHSASPLLYLAERPSVAPDPFRMAMRHLAGAVCVVTTADRSGKRFGLTVTSVTSVSLDPPLVLTCVDARSRSLAPLRASGQFAIHLLSEDQEELARQFAGPSPDRFAGIAYQTSPGGAALLDGVIASLECVVHQIVPAGDHMVVIGRVVCVHPGETGESGPFPLLYVDRRYAGIAR